MKPIIVKSNQDGEEARKAHHAQIQLQVEGMEPEVRAKVREAQAIVDLEISKINSEVFDFERENRLRDKGISPRHAEELALIIKDVKVGQLFEFYGKIKVVTPFKTVVSGQEYVTFLQERILDNPQFKKEVELCSALKSYTSLSNFGLIKLAIKRIFRSKKNG
jgi:hypothetical protein